MADYKLALPETVIVPQKSVGDVNKVNLQFSGTINDGKVEILSVVGNVTTSTGMVAVNLNASKFTGADLSELLSVINAALGQEVVTQLKKL